VAKLADLAKRNSPAPGNDANMVCCYSVLRIQRWFAGEQLASGDLANSMTRMIA